MKVREANIRDLHAVTEITVSSLQDDPTYVYMWPHRERFPQDNFYFWYLSLKEDLFNEKICFMVVVTERLDEFDPEVPAGTVISYGMWERVGSSSAAKERWSRKNTWSNVFDKWITWLERKKVDVTGKPRRDADFARVQAFQKELNRVEAEHFRSKHPEMWCMRLLATQRGFRRHGAASHIISWGVTEADKEDVCCGTETSPMGDHLYHSFGFEKVGRMFVTVPGDEAFLDIPVVLRKPEEDIVGYEEY